LPPGEKKLPGAWCLAGIWVNSFRKTLYKIEHPISAPQPKRSFCAKPWAGGGGRATPCMTPSKTNQVARIRGGKGEPGTARHCGSARTPGPRGSSHGSGCFLGAFKWVRKRSSVPKAHRGSGGRLLRNEEEILSQGDGGGGGYTLKKKKLKKNPDWTQELGKSCLDGQKKGARWAKEKPKL